LANGVASNHEILRNNEIEMMIITTNTNNFVTWFGLVCEEGRIEVVVVTFVR
jgi:hypothetical protein